VVSENVERAVSAGVPLEQLVGAERFFGDMLSELPEVAYIAVATGRIVLEAGERIDPYLAPPRARKDVRSHPIMPAEQALRILRDGVSPGELPIARATDFAYVVNMEVARRLGRYPPFSFMQIAETVGR